MKKRITFTLTVGCLLMLCWMDGAAKSKARQFRGNREAKPFTYNLPKINKVELLHLEEHAEGWNGKIEASKILSNTEAKTVASLWRALPYKSLSATCHNPAYGIRFFAGDKLLVFATICYDCDNIRFDTPELGRTQGFYGDSKKGQQLLEIFRTAFPNRSTSRR
jgi:hypothetical protein